MSHSYTEDQLVEQPAIGLFAELGWTTVSATDETFGATGTLLREMKGEVVLVSRCPDSSGSERLNPALTPEAITAAVSGIVPVLAAGEMAFFNEIPRQNAGHGGGHKYGQNSGVFSINDLFSGINTDIEPDIYADI